MRILFVHQNFPAQYVHLAAALAADPKNEVVALTINANKAIPNVRTIRYNLTRGSTPGIHSLAEDFEAKTLRGESAAIAAIKLRGEGFYPDVICGHIGWGETLFLKDVWPSSKLLCFLEFAYNFTGADVGFDREFFGTDEKFEFKVRTKNAGLLLALASSDALVSPTRWQAAQFPSIYRNIIEIVHDGIDTNIAKPNPSAQVTLGRDSIALGCDDEVITFVNRNLEPYRGYHVFMRALPEIMRRRPQARVVIVGGNSVSYGSPPPHGKSYRQIFLEEVQRDVDVSRIHFVGILSYETLLTLFQVSSVHIYLTYPFVLSWSLLEAMAVSCAIVASSTPPVKEFISDQKNGLLVDFFSPSEISRAVVSVLENPEQFKDMRANARNTIVASCDLNSICLPKQIDLVKRTALGR